MSEEHIDIQTQLPDHTSLSNTTWVETAGNSSAKAHVKSKPRFAEFMCSHAQVISVFLEIDRPDDITLGLSLCAIDHEASHTDDLFWLHEKF